MIARTWRGRATPQNAGAYVRHFTDTVVPALKSLAGHRGAWLLRRDGAATTEFLAVTLWESRDFIKAFAGADISRAHVEPQARAALSDFDDHADHYEVAVASPG
jgi:heme-degrading monooxygenase HmoA